MGFAKMSAAAAALAGFGLLLAGASAQAAVLEQYEFQGQAGNETSVASSFLDPALTGVAFADSAALTPTSGANSINAGGFNRAGAFYSFGFGIAAGNTVTVDQLVLTTRSSGTGPGFISLQASIDGGAFSTVASITQNGTNFNDETLAITPVTASSSVMFRLLAANSTSANGGTIGSAGTFRVGDFNPAGTPTPFSVDGTISTLAAAVPEPATWSLMILGLGAVGAALRGRRWASARFA